jgi:hypothetical protein
MPGGNGALHFWLKSADGNSKAMFISESSPFHY